MKIEDNNLEYGIYIDHKHSYIIAMKHIVHEELIEEITIDKNSHAAGSKDINQQIHIQNKKNEQAKKFCKSIISKIDHAKRILVFGPAELKFELKHELEETKSLKNAYKELLRTDYMEKEEAIRFAADHFHKTLMPS